MAERTRVMLEAPIARTLMRLAIPNTLVLVAQACAGLIETYFVGKLGTDALAGVALVMPIIMLTQMMSGGAIGGGIVSSIARALGGGRRDDADALASHGLLVGLLFGLLFTAVVLIGGRQLYGSMGGTGASLDAALTYSNVVFAGAVLIWAFNSLASVVRGTGNMTLPAKVVCAGTVMLLPLSPLLIFGWGPVPGFGVAGGGIALLIYYTLGIVAMLVYLHSPRSLLKPHIKGFKFRWPLAREILRVGLVAALSSIATNLVIGFGTAQVGAFGPAAIAGYGTATRLEYLLIPLVYGLGGPLVAMVGTCIGAGQRERALRATWIGTALAVALTETVGLLAALFPRAWLRLFDSDPVMIEAGTQYLRIVGPFYGFFGLGLILYFASQGAGKLLWPVIGNVTRLVIAAVGGWVAIHLGAGVEAVFIAQAAALVFYGLSTGLAVAGGAWFGPVGWPRRTAAMLHRADSKR